MTNFQTCLAKHLSIELGCEICDVTKALNTFTKTSIKPVEKYTCERVPRGHSEPCGKKAKNQIELTDGTKHWYCGTQKSGCSKSIWSMIDKEKQKNIADDIFKETVSKKSGSTGKDRKQISDKKTESFLKKKKIIRETKLQCKKIKTKTNGFLYMDYATRILFNEKTKKAYGILGEDNNEILSLGKKEKDWLELHNFLFEDDGNNSEEDDGNDSEEDSDDEIDLDDM